MTIYTRTGDRGETGLPGGMRVAKDADVLEICGTLDELNALLGMVRCRTLAEETGAVLKRIQQRLFDVGTELVTNKNILGPQDVAELEQKIDQYADRLKPLRSFILPAGSETSASLHLARAVCRRAERRLVTLARAQPQTVPPALLAYMNRLGDLLFVLARAANADEGVPEELC